MVGYATRRADPLTPEQARDRLDRTGQAVADAIGCKPYGAINDTIRGAVDRPMVLWIVDTLGWKFRGSAKVTQTVPLSPPTARTREPSA